MSAQHTPGRLEVAVEIFDNDGTPETALQALGGSATVAVALDFGPNNPGMREANSRRLVACWNACEGISTEALEDEAPRKLREDRDQILVQRNELLELLQGVLKCERGMLGHLVLELWQEEVIRSAIAGATGGAA
jgi:hypothetical protein